MRPSSTRATHSRTPHKINLCDTVRAALETTFTAARQVLVWDDEPTIVPGFQARADGLAVIVRYLQPPDGAIGLRRTRARAMLEQYRLTLVARGWQVDVVEAGRSMPYLRCQDAENIMSNKGVPCLLP